MTRPQGEIRFDNAGRVALVTGGANGIGRAVVDAFLTSHCAGVILDSQTPQGILPANLVWHQGDVTSAIDCMKAVELATKLFGGLDILINNAAIQPPESYKSMAEIDMQLWRRVMDVNVAGYAQMAQAALQVMLQQQSGVIINIASAQAHRTAREVPAYGPSKAANVMQAKQWGVEFARQGIRVASISPGAIGTPLLKASLAAQGGESALANRHPLGRLGTPEEIANAVLWLASSAASFVTATDLEVDGGLGAFAAFAEPYPDKSALRH
jgi:NAD(P)-dependent dehydrogenase (short-subunit alcohol dehydrogenase family)